jgi:DDE superfamily endonuclease
VAPGGDLVRPAGRSGLRQKKGAIEQLYTDPPAGSVVVCLDEMGPQASKSYPGRRPVRPDASPAERAKQEIDYGRRGPAGYVFGAFRPAAGAALTATYERRTLGNWVDFLGKVEGWIDAGVERVYAVLDNLDVHTACDALLFSLAHPRWEFVFQPRYAAYLNLIEPWWKVLRSLALEGRRFEGWAEIEQAIERATTYWNEHKHPFVVGSSAPAQAEAALRRRRPTKSNSYLADAPVRVPPRRRQRVPAEAPLVQHQPAAAQVGEAGALDAAPAVVRHHDRRRPVRPLVGRSRQQVVDQRLLQRVQDEGAPRRPVERHQQLAAAADEVRVGAVAVRVVVEDAVLGVPDRPHARLSRRGGSGCSARTLPPISSARRSIEAGAG